MGTPPDKRGQPALVLVSEVRAGNGKAGLRLSLVAGAARQPSHREQVREPFPLNPALSTPERTGVMRCLQKNSRRGGLAGQST